MVLKESTRKYILIGIVLLIVIGLVSAKVMGKKQDEEFSMDDALYQQVQTLYEQQKFEEAKTYSDELLKRQPNSEVVNYMGGLVAANVGEMEQAAILLQKTLDINPHKVEDPMFMLQFGQVLVSAERYADAQTVLVRCRDMGWAPAETPTYQETVAQLLTQVEANL